MGVFSGAFSDPVQREVRYWWSRVDQAAAWRLYDDATASLVRIENHSQAPTTEAYQSATDKLKTAAEQGLAQAMLDYGELLCLGPEKFIRRDRAAGQYWIESAALMGHPRAQLAACQKKCGF